MQTASQRTAGEDLADVERVLRGETAAFEGIVRRWQGPLINMAWRYCRDRGRAEEGPGPVAARRQLLNMAVCARCECISFGTQAISHGRPAA